MEESGYQVSDSEESVELSAEHINEVLQSVSKEESMNSLHFNGTRESFNDNVPSLHISEQPQCRGFRFRYKCEGPSHGGLQGVRSEKSKKTFPTVQIFNYTGPALFVVSLVTDETVPSIHAHELVGKHCTKGICTIEVKNAVNPICQLQNIGVMHVTKRKVVDILKERILESMLLDKRISTGDVNNTEIELDENDVLKAQNQAAKQAKNMQLNVVRLCFQAYLFNKDDGKFSFVLPSVISNAIYDSKSPGAAALKICRMDKYGGCCTGNEEVFLLCEKVQKDDISVVFMEKEGSNVTWRELADFGPTDVHKQYAIVFKTPPYHNLDIKEPIQVYIKLERLSDSECSDPKLFTYHPRILDGDDIAKKRRKVLMDLSSKPSSNSNFGNYKGSDSSNFRDFLEDPFSPFPPNGGSSSGINNMKNRNCQTSSVFDIDECDSGVERSTSLTNLIRNRSFENQMKPIHEPEDYSSDPDLEVDAVPCQPLIDKSLPSSCSDVEYNKQTSYKVPYNNQVPYEEGNVSEFSPVKNKSGNKSQTKSETKPETKAITKPETKALAKTQNMPQTKAQSKPQTKTQTSLIETQIEASAENIKMNLNMLLALRSLSINGSVKDILLLHRNLIAIPDSDGDNCLHLALINSQSAVVDNMLEIITSVPGLLDNSNYHFQTGLHMAVLTNQVNMVGHLLEHGAKRTNVDHRGNTAVHLAIKYNYLDCLSILLHHPVTNHLSKTRPLPELDILNFDGLAPIHLACLAGNRKAVELLVGHGADVDASDGKSGRTALHIAVEKNDLLMASYLLLEADCNSDCVTFDDNTPLHLACGRDYDNIVGLLLALGADPDVSSGLLDYYFSDDSDVENNKEQEECQSGTGIKPRDLVQNNDKIMRMLNGESYISLSNEDSTYFSTGHSINRSSYCEGDMYKISETTRLHLATLLDSVNFENNWRALAKVLDLEYIIDAAATSPGSPTLCILDMYETLGGYMENLYKGLCAINRPDVMCVLKPMKLPID